MGYLEDKRNALMMNVVSGGGRLPNEFQEVEWIGSSGTQYIDTGVYNTATTSYAIEFSTEASPTDTNLFGARIGSAQKSQVVFINTSSNKGIAIHYGISATERIDTGWIYRENLIDIKTKLEVQNTLVDTTIIVNDNIVYQSVQNKTDFTSSITDFLFARNYNGVVVLCGKFKIYTCKLYNNEILERDFIPCYRKSDDVIGMYDTVTQTFYTNAGSGFFTKGADVN